MSSDPYRHQVKDVMSKVVITANSEDTVHDALTLMVENKISALPVIDRRQRCLGILSATDLLDIARAIDEGLSDLGRVGDTSRQWLLEKLSEHDMGHQTIGGLMTADVASVRPEAPAAHAAREMLRHRVHRLPVVDDEGRLLGIVSTMDVLAVYVDGAPD
jgi:CBS domain-containing protein